MTKEQALKWAIIMFVGELVLTASFVIPLFLTMPYGWLYGIIEKFAFITDLRLVAIIIYSIVYLAVFLTMYFDKRLNRKLSYCLFSLLHFSMVTPILFDLFANNDGQAILLIFQYGFFAALLSLPFARLWVNKKSSAEPMPQIPHEE